MTREGGFKWKLLLDYALSQGDTIEFTVSSKEKQWPAVVSTLMPFLVESFKARWYYGAQQSRKVTILHFHNTPEVAALLRTPPTFFDYRFWQPEMPEDPTFYRNGEAIVWTISHEIWVYMLLTEQEAEVWRARGFELDPQGRIEIKSVTRREEL